MSSCGTVVAILLDGTLEIPKLAEELDSASPLEIMDRALSLFGEDVAIAFRYGLFLSVYSVGDGGKGDYFGP